MQPRVRGIEFREEFKMLEPRVLPAQVLARQRGAQRAQQSWTMQNEDILALIQALDEWINDSASVLLVLDAVRGKEIIAELIASVLQLRTPRICWSLSASVGRDEVLTPAAILGNLVWQLHRLDPAKAVACLDGNVDHTSESQMARLMASILVQIGECYLIIEVVDAITMSSMRNNAVQLHYLSALLHSISDQVSRAGGQVKILLVGRLTVKNGASCSASIDHPGKGISLGPSVPVPANRQRHGARSFFQSSAWLNFQNRNAKKR